MASFTSAGSSMTLRVQVGVKPSGVADLKSMTLSKIDAGATADAVSATGIAIGAVLAYPVSETFKTDKDLVVA